MGDDRDARRGLHGRVGAGVHRPGRRRSVGGGDHRPRRHRGAGAVPRRWEGHSRRTGGGVPGDGRVHGRPGGRDRRLRPPTPRR
ncbi:MAG TPA: hypothetical protein ENK55_02135 [Actinobacteria bacterium]|nr:hypothetical protein [Actinomycetota bacterium]